MDTLEVELGQRSYPIHIGRGLLESESLIAGRLPGKRALVVSDEAVAPRYLAQLRRGLRAVDTAELVLPRGEASKTLDTAARIIDALAAHHCQRDSAVIALGGGVVGDLAGFAAACFQRGIAWLQVPTTLLAQVDASVGGKTGVNHAGIKNLIGAFHQPVAVVADTDTLATLDLRELRAGLAEVIKHGVILDPVFFAWLEDNVGRLLGRDPDALAHAIRRSCEIKAAVVAGDERELGRRALLNLGHSFGHAIESVSGFGEWLHGEAVAAGIAMAARMSRAMGLLDDAGCERIIALLSAAGLPAGATALDAGRLRAAMATDKKQRGGRLRLVLIDAIGAARVTAEFPDALLAETLAQSTASQCRPAQKGAAK
ncbi:MAG TPA: 3-dehydroquinate synthase [Gammaproteobacteria bacterium]|nr:3-dehydroquinate synthase [Gammaproteobacteria bacterium]